MTSLASGLRSRRVVGIAVAVACLIVVMLAVGSDGTDAILLGTGSGAVIAAVAVSIVLTYRGSGVVNFAAGALAMYSGFVFAALYEQGNVFLLAWTVHVGRVGILAAAIITVAIGAVIGLLCELLVFRMIRTASPLAKLVASVGLLLTFQALAAHKFGTNGLGVSATLSSGVAHLPYGMRVPTDEIIVAGAVILVGVFLWMVFRFTRFGVATRALTDSELGTILLGYSPTLLGATSWMLAGAIGAVFAVLFDLLSGSVDPTTITLLVVPALAVALLGQFRSFGLAIAGGLTLGLIEGLVQYLGTKSWYPQSAGAPLPGVSEAIPLLLIIGILFVRGNKFPVRGDLTIVRLPFSPQSRHLGKGMTVAAAATILVLLLLGPTWRLATINSLIGVVLCLSLVVLVGFVGQISLAQMALAGTSAFLLSRIVTLSIGFPLAPIIACAAATAIGMLVAIPAVRVRGVQLAAVTVSAAVVIEAMFFKNTAWTGGYFGSTIPTPSFAGLSFGPSSHYHGVSDGQFPNPWFGVFCLIVMLVGIYVVGRLRAGASGRRMLAVRSNERAAAANGIGVSATKLAAFGLSAFLCGLAGVLSAYRFGSASDDYFGGFASLTVLAYAYMGGITSVTGAVVGGLLVANGAIFTALQQWVGLPDAYTPLIAGLGLIVTVILNPDGIAGGTRLLAHRAGVALRMRSLAQVQAAEGDMPAARLETRMRAEAPEAHVNVEVAGSGDSTDDQV